MWVVEGGVQVFQGLTAQLAVFERLAPFDGGGQTLAGLAMQAQPANGVTAGFSTI